MIIRYLVIFLSLGVEAAFSLPFLTVEMMQDLLRRNGRPERFLQLLFFAFLLAVFYHLSLSITLLLWGSLLIAQHLLSSKLALAVSSFLAMIAFHIYIFYQAELVMNWVWLFHLVIFIVYFYKKNFRIHV